MATETKSSVVKVKPRTQDSSSSKMKIDSSASRMKIDSGKQPVSDSKMKSTTLVTKSEVKSKTTSESSKTTTKTSTTRVREKKVYGLPGQKYDPPEEREPLRIFYESLSKQIPTSEMAEFWMMEHGLLSPERAKKAFDKKQRKQKELRTGTPIKSSNESKPPTRPESSKKQQQASKNGDFKAKKRIVNESDDDDFILSPKRRKG